MAKATVDKKILDTLIRAKVASLEACKGVRPLPVAWQSPDQAGVNWAISGWVGANDDVRECEGRMQGYLQVLRANFQIPGEDRAGA